MKNQSAPADCGFDAYAEAYDRALAEGISVSGEDKDYFARGRVAWLADCLKSLGARTDTVLDFGCGTGSSTPFLLGLPEVRLLTGVDVSAKSLEVAVRIQTSPRVRFVRLDDYQPDGTINLAFCNGVFHHIPLAERAEAMRRIFRSLRPGGWFAFWENNPWNPGTRYVMSRIPFDRDTVTLSAPDARRLLRDGGFEIARTDFLFLFPRMLRWFRPVEPLLARLPLGAQYQVLARKPA